MKRLFFVLSSLWNKPTARLAAGFLFCVLTLGLFAPVLPLADPAAIDLGNKFISPCSAHWLGTDALGRDIFSRLIWGIRSSVYTALVATLLTALFGTLWGLVSAAANRQTDELMMRFCDLWMSFPFGTILATASKTWLSVMTRAGDFPRFLSVSESSLSLTAIAVAP